MLAALGTQWPDAYVNQEIVTLINSATIVIQRKSVGLVLTRQTKLVPGSGEKVLRNPQVNVQSDADRHCFWQARRFASFRQIA